jgi:pimeloyl-ACP methyl ester carboxylesterase
MREIKIDNDVLSYVELGHGKPVLAIHGLGGNWAVWLQNLPELASGYRVIAIDLPGFGRSGPSGHGVAISGYSRLVSSLVDELALERPVLVGNSLGGWIAADVALRVPDRVGGLVLVDAGGVVPTAAERRRSLLMMGGAARLAPFAPRFRGAIASRRRLRWIALRSTFARPAEVAGDLVYMAMPAAPDPAFRPALLAATATRCCQSATRESTPAGLSAHSCESFPTRATFR